MLLILILFALLQRTLTPFAETFMNSPLQYLNVVCMANYVDVRSINWESEVSRSEILTLVYFWHDECPWCLRLNPIFDEITEEFRGKIKFAKLNILENEENREMATNLGVMGTPTMMFFCHGRSTGQTVGFMAKEQLEQALRDMLQKYKTCILQSTELKPFYIV